MTHIHTTNFKIIFVIPKSQNQHFQLSYFSLQIPRSVDLYLQAVKFKISSQEKIAEKVIAKWDSCPLTKWMWLVQWSSIRKVFLPSPYPPHPPPSPCHFDCKCHTMPYNTVLWYMWINKQVPSDIQESLCSSVQHLINTLTCELHCYSLHL